MLPLRCALGAAVDGCAAASVPEVEQFTFSWSALRRAVAHCSEGALAAPSGCRGWRNVDLVQHLAAQAQELLIALATPAETAPTADALSWWTPAPPLPDGRCEQDALLRRLSDVHDGPAPVAASFERLAAAAERAAQLSHPDLPVTARERTLTVRDLLGALVLEATLHHLDLVAHLPSAQQPPDDGLAASRKMVERRLRIQLPPQWADADALRLATGRRAPTPAERTALDDLGVRGRMLPLSFG